LLFSYSFAALYFRHFRRFDAAMPSLPLLITPFSYQIADAADMPFYARARCHLHYFSFMIFAHA